MVDPTPARDWGHAELAELLPPPARPLLAERWAEAPAIDLTNKYRGALIGGAVGDALGRPVEGRSREAIAHRYGTLREFQPWRGYVDGPRGTFTDDTQMTMCVADWMISADGQPDPAELATRFQEWLPIGRGKGQACVEAIERLNKGEPWWTAGTHSAGNGAAMRVAPIGMVYAADLDGLRSTAAVSALITHAHPMALASAIAQAFLTARLLWTAPGSLEVSALLDDLQMVLEDVADDGQTERKPGSTQKVRLRDRLNEVGERLEQHPNDAIGHFYNGAFVLESLPAALWCFLRSPEDPEQTIVTAVNAGRDADTVAAMAGTLSGAYLGESAIPARWTGADLEEADTLRLMADRLLDLAVGHDSSPSSDGAS